jgi:hypothetical protein
MGKEKGKTVFVVSEKKKKQVLSGIKSSVAINVKGKNQELQTLFPTPSSQHSSCSNRRKH